MGNGATRFAGGLVDAMAHLDDPRVADPEAVLALASAAGIGVVINAGFDPLAVQEPSWADAGVTLRWAYGIHPQVVGARNPATQLAALRELLDRPGVVAVGELGLDARKGMPTARAQEEALLAQLEIAHERRLPLILHCVRRLGRLLELLAAHGPWPAGGMLHGFAGPQELVAPALELGFYFSFGGLVTRPSSKRCRAAATMVPCDRLLVESDTPDHPPAWCQGPSEPAAIRHTLCALANLRQVPEAELGDVTARNARRLFRI